MVESRLPEKSSASDPSPVPMQDRKLDRNSADPLEAIVQTVAEEHLEDEHGSHGSKWLASIEEKVEQGGKDDTARSWSKLSIYRIPQFLKDVEDMAYVPQIVSIGPYHHGERRLRHMERHKWRLLHHVLKRTKRDVRVYLDAVREMEEKARACYEGTADMSSDAFVEMMVLDGCFVLELFRGTVGEGLEELGYTWDDPVFSTRGSTNPIQRDLILLENQIPMFVLERLLGLQLGNPDQKRDVARLAIGFFETLMRTDEPLQQEKTTCQTKLQSLNATTTSIDLLYENSGLHCLDVFRNSLLWTGRLCERRKRLLWTGPRCKWRIRIKRRSHATPDDDKRQHIHCVSELRKAGIKFKKRENAQFWDIKFEKGILWIPQLLIHDDTRSLFRNLIAFEQSHFDCSNNITSYTVFMDNLINSPEDVMHLHHWGIIEHLLGSDDEVAHLFNWLCLEVVFDINKSYLKHLFAEVNSHYDHRWNAWIASLKHDYFHSPWSIISFVAAVVLLLLTLAQTFYSVYGYYWPHS